MTFTGSSVPILSDIINQPLKGKTPKTVFERDLGPG